MKINAGMHISGVEISRPAIAEDEDHPDDLASAMIGFSFAKIYSIVTIQMSGVTNIQQYFIRGDGLYPIISSMLS